MKLLKKRNTTQEVYSKYSTLRFNKGRTFADLVLAVVRKIPKGGTMTYGEVARHAGNARAARAVGAVLRTNYDPKIPCHRVIRANGFLGGYNRGIKNKIKKLKREKFL